MDELRGVFTAESHSNYLCEEATKRAARVFFRTLISCPPVLIIHFSSLHHDVRGLVSRSIPFELDLAPFAEAGLAAVTTYRLVSIVESHPGHFTAAVLRSVGVPATLKWFRINDSVVRRLPSWEQKHKVSVESQVAFLLFYQRTDKPFW